MAPQSYLRDRVRAVADRRARRSHPAPLSGRDSRLRAGVFVDYWNFTLAHRHTSLDRRGDVWQVDWTRFPGWLVEQAEAELGLESALEHVGTTVFTSYNPDNPRSLGHKNWVDGFLRRQRQMRVFMYKQQQRDATRCANCGEEVDVCPKCDAPLVSYQEKRVDTGLAVRVAEAARDGTHDVIILLTADRDLIEAVESARRAGCQVVQAAFPPGGSHLGRLCDAVIDIDAGRGEISR